MKIIFKTSKKVFLSTQSKEEVKLWFDKEYCLKAVERNGYALRYVDITKKFLKVSY